MSCCCCCLPPSSIFFSSIMASSCVRLGQKSHHHMQRKAFLDRRYAENPPSGFGMGQGQYGKQSSIPDTEVQYVHKDEYGNTHLLTRELSHQERYKTLAKSNDRGKLVMGIHRTVVRDCGVTFKQNYNFIVRINKFLYYLVFPFSCANYEQKPEKC